MPSYIVVGTQTTQYTNVEVRMRDENGDVLYIKDSDGYYVPKLRIGQSSVEKIKSKIFFGVEDEFKAVTLSKIMFSITPSLPADCEFQMKNSFDVNDVIEVEECSDMIDNSWSTDENGLITFNTWDVTGLTGPGRGGRNKPNGFESKKKRDKHGHAWYQMTIEPVKFAAWLKGLISNGGVTSWGYQIPSDELSVIDHVLSKLGK